MHRPIMSVLLAAALAAAPLVATGQGAAAPPESTARQQAQVEPLLVALGLDALLPVMRQEGLAHADDLARDMLPGRGGARWDALVDEIYDVDRMRRIMRASVAADLPEEAVAPLLAFFTSELGERVVGLEVSARRALLDEAVEEASHDALRDLRAGDSPRLTVIESFVEANDLVEMNVVGALNSNYAFYQGLSAGNAFDGELSEEEMIRDVWNQEAQIRADTRQWVYSYLAMAYRPLTDAEIDRYTALSLTPEGQALNTALFAGFDRMFGTISRELGLAAAQLMSGEDI